MYCTYIHTLSNLISGRVRNGIYKKEHTDTQASTLSTTPDIIRSHAVHEIHSSYMHSFIHTYTFIHTYIHTHSLHIPYGRVGEEDSERRWAQVRVSIATQVEVDIHDGRMF